MDFQYLHSCLGHAYYGACLPAIACAWLPPTRAPMLAPAAAELLDGRPHGDEGELLQHFEAEVDGSVAHLRQLKAANEASQAAISEAVAQIASAHEAFERQHVALAGELSRMQAEAAAHEAAAADRVAALQPEGGSGGAAA